MNATGLSNRAVVYLFVDLCAGTYTVSAQIPSEWQPSLVDQGSNDTLDSDGESDDARTLRPLQAAACTYRIAFGPRAGQKVLTLKGAMPRETDFKQTLCADIEGFSLHAAVRCGADDRKALEQLCRYITRPALANERVQTNAAGQVVLSSRRPGATAPRTW